MSEVPYKSIWKFIKGKRMSMVFDIIEALANLKYVMEKHDLDSDIEVIFPLETLRKITRDRDGAKYLRQVEYFEGELADKIAGIRVSPRCQSTSRAAKISANPVIKIRKLASGTYLATCEEWEGVLAEGRTPTDAYSDALMQLANYRTIIAVERKWNS